MIHRRLNLLAFYLLILVLKYVLDRQVRHLEGHEMALSWLPEDLSKDLRNLEDHGMALS